MVTLVLLAVFAVFACACAESYEDEDRFIRSPRRAVTEIESTGCMHEGRWYTPGSAVRTRTKCLRCMCTQGALSCQRRTCAPLPEPPPRCHVIHQKGECCPELRCPDDIKQLEHGISARLYDSEIDTPSSIGHVFPACVEGGTVYAAGSAMTSNTACEQCFCLGGARRCVKPVCLPPPPGCKARPAPGACCPQRYYCEHGVTKPLGEMNPHDCITPEGKWAYEGERVKAAETTAKCIQCFCLRGSVRCQHLSCAPTLQGCTPLVQSGQCCPHQYRCDRQKNSTSTIPNLNHQRQNILMSLNDEHRSFHISKSAKRETTVKELTTHKSTAAVTVTKNDPVTTVKVKRKTDDDVITDSNLKLEKSFTTTSESTQTTLNVNDISSTFFTESTTEDLRDTTTEQPEGSVKIIINGTINCTAELSSTSLLLNVSDPDVWITSETQPRIPIVNNIENESPTFSPNEIITEGNYDEEFNENETFTINVTSSLRTNTTQSTTTVSSSTAIPKTVPPLLIGVVNISKVKKEDDYDYAEPALPPSLPNLKIIPFVAADAVVDEDISSKESPDYAELETDDKFPVYYPSKEIKESSFAIRKEDVYNPTQYPVFVSKKVEPQYPSLTQEEGAENVAFTSMSNDSPPHINKYTVATSLGNSAILNSKIYYKTPTASTKFEVEAPAVNLFSPPVETEGGFIPKTPEIIDDYYSVYQSTPPPPQLIPHLTTSMQLEPKDECMASDGRRVPEGEAITIACSLCSCAWGELHCSPRPCNTPPGCKRVTASTSTSDLCCGELICDKRNRTIHPPVMSTHKFTIDLNDSKVPFKSEIEQPLVFVNTENISYSSTVASTQQRIPDEQSTKTNQEILKNTTTANYTTIPLTEIPLHVTSTTESKGKPQNVNHSLEYDEEDDDEGFSLGSVLQLLLSETYETTTGTPKRKINTEVPKLTSSTLTTKKIYTTSDDVFMPVTHRFPVPPTKLYDQNNINRIDHLLLGESSAIRKTTLRPMTTTKPVITTRQTYSTKTTSRPTTTKSIEITSKEGFVQSVDVRPPAHNNLLATLNLGLPKLAGCNIYGRMYRVGRIIAELSSPCQECKCTELGVQCRSLTC